MSDPFDRRELFALFSQSVDGTLSPADHARLEAILTESADARQLWFLYSDLETGLADWSALQQQPPSTISPISRGAAARGAKPFVYRGIAAAAAVLLATVGIVYWSQTALEDSAQGFAAPTRSANAEWTRSGEYGSARAILPPYDHDTLRLLGIPLFTLLVGIVFLAALAGLSFGVFRWRQRIGKIVVIACAFILLLFALAFMFVLITVVSGSMG